MCVNHVQQASRSVTIAESDACGRWTRVDSWIWLIVASVGAGVAFVALMVGPRASQLLALVGLAGALTASVLFVVRIGIELDNVSAVGAAIMFAFAGTVAGYWATAAMLPLLARSDDAYPFVVKSPPTGDNAQTAVVLLSCAEPARYSVRVTARALQRLLATGALEMPAGAMPFVFLSEKARYRQIRDRHPARDVVRGVAERLEVRLSAAGGAPVLVAWCDGRPSLVDASSAAISAGYDRIVVAVAGADGAFEATTAIHAAEEALRSASPPAHMRTAQSIWRVESLAVRLCERILETTQGVERGAVGVALIAEGVPAQWASDHAAWAERETYFLQRVRLLLTERGIKDNAVRIGWLEWQSPDVTETVRHLAATGCERIIVVPATAAGSTLGIMVDLPHLIESARLPDEVHAITLSAWNDDPGLVEALADSIGRVLARE
jgi:protoheme ferro-lyase